VAWLTRSFESSWAVHAGELAFVIGNLTYSTTWDGQDEGAIRSADDPSGERFLPAEEMMRGWGAFTTTAIRPLRL